MQTIYSFLLSDGAAALHFLLTMVLLAVVILRGLQGDARLRRLARENSDLKRQLVEMSDYVAGSLRGVRRRLDRQRDTICHAADCIAGTSSVDVERFHSLYDDFPQEPSDMPMVVDFDVEFDQEELPGPDLSMAESAFVEPDAGRDDPDVSMPLRASLTTIPQYDEVIEDVVAEEPRPQNAVDFDAPDLNAPDLMTRALKRSRGH